MKGFSALKYTKLFKSYFLFDVCTSIDCVGNEGNTLYLPVRVTLPSSSWERSIINLLIMFTEQIFIYVCMLHVQCASIYMHKDILKLECMGGYLFLYLSKKVDFDCIYRLPGNKVVQNGQCEHDIRAKIFQWYWRFWIDILKNQ